MSRTSQKFIIVAGVIFTMTVASITTIYVPMKANESKPKDSGDQKEVVRGSRGSMWKNMDREIKNREKT